jgi:hypothetical protein
MHKFEILREVEGPQLRNFLKYVKYSKFNLFPNATNSNISNFLFEQINSRLKDSLVFSCIVNNEIIVLAIVHILQWDSDYFGYKCASIEDVFYNFSSDNELLLQALNRTFCEIEKETIRNNIKFMSISINAEDSVVSSALQSSNFKYILTWINGIYNSKKRIEFNNDNLGIDIIKESEIDYYKDLALNYYFKGGRFYLDKNFDTSLVNNMYSNLVTSSFKNNDIMLSYRSKGRPLGLFICKKIVKYEHFENLRVAPLRYLVIDPKVRQKHIGYELFAGTINFLLDNCDIITSGLEVHNLPSLNLHTKLNFKFNYSHNLFHWWSHKL